MDWSDNWRDAFRIELRAEAVGLAWRGWPIMPGTYPTGEAWTDGEHDRVNGPEPVDSDWKLQVAAKPEEVASIWTGRPYSLLVATGTVLDAVEVPAAIGMRVAGLLRTVGVVAPIAATPEGRWIFLTTPGRRINPELRAHPEIKVRGAGDWIPLPPSSCQHGIVHWRVKPQTCGWQLAEAGFVQDAISQVLSQVDVDNDDRVLATQRLSA
ncbi:bifunctional DNA primase/polymerase [Sciscionella sediminilitoris]|uniref:bifunctional DNA primase/polymerase n=1 Tax=Sciscionella sediminilitoris TaxID=1445613 RepID=UPI0004DEE6C1|nr:bifunctional DNA primase/polymerase [Sciscionella sp. SE31]